MGCQQMLAMLLHHVRVEPTTDITKCTWGAASLTNRLLPLSLPAVIEVRASGAYLGPKDC